MEAQMDQEQKPMSKEKIYEMREQLLEVFDEAVKRHSSYYDPRESGEYSPTNLAIESRKAIAELAQALVAVDGLIERREAETDAKTFGLDKIKKNAPANGNG
jgi:hypothetical protein